MSASGVFLSRCGVAAACVASFVSEGCEKQELRGPTTKVATSVASVPAPIVGRAGGHPPPTDGGSPPVMDVPCPERADWVVIEWTSDVRRGSLRFASIARGGARVPTPTELLPFGYAAADPTGASQDMPMGPLPGKRVSARNARENSWLHVAVAEELDPMPSVLTLTLASASSDHARMFDAVLHDFRTDGAASSPRGSQLPYRVGRYVLPVPEGMRLSYADLRGAEDSLQVGWDTCDRLEALGKSSTRNRTSSGYEWSVVDRSSAERTAVVSFGDRCLWATHDCYADREFAPHPEQAHRAKCLRLETIVDGLVPLTADSVHAFASE